LLVGMGVGRLSFDIKGIASKLLSQGVIPLVMIYTIAGDYAGLWVMMIGMAVMMGLMLCLGQKITQDPIKNLCFFYLNIGWLGLPIASALFGDNAARIMIAAYVGSSLFGNSIGVGLLVPGQDLKIKCYRVLKTPPAWALLIGVACIPFGHALQLYGKPLYDVLKFLMSFLGMMVLGIWLSKTPLTSQDFKLAFKLFLVRLLTVSLLMYGFIQICRYYHLNVLVDNQATLYLIALLPPAANIIVLETHYMKSGRSASLIAWGTCLSMMAIAVYGGYYFL
jgi:predicted permease